MNVGASGERGRDEQGPWDAGLQPERTTLAWVRTAMAFAVVSLLVGRLSSAYFLVPVVASSSGLGVAWLLLAVQPRRHDRRSGSLLADGYPVAPLAALLLVVATVGVAAMAFVLVVA